MARPVDLLDWHLNAIDMMARSGCSLGTAASELGLKITTEDCQKLLRKPSFQKLLFEQRHRYFNALASDPNFNKDTVVGKLIALAQKMEENGDYDKAADAFFKIAKIQNWMGPESTVNVFGDLSAKDLADIRTKLGTTQSGKAN